MASALRARVAENVVVLVPTTALLDQWYVALQEEMGVRESEIGLWSGGRRPNGRKSVNVMVLNTARSEIQAASEPQKTLLVVDECHRISSPINSTILTYEFAATLGMSATPDSDTGDRLSRVLEPRLGPLVFRYSLDQAYEDGVLARFDLVNVKVDLLNEEMANYERWTRRIHAYVRKHPNFDRGDATLRSLLQKRAVVSARARLRIPVATRIADENRGARTLIFHEYKSDAETILAQVLARGHSATLYHSGVTAAMRRDNLRLFRRGQFDILVTCRALDEGINIPEVQVAIISSATASARQRVQRLGRVLRPAPRKSHALVYSIYATGPEESRLQAEALRLKSANSITWKKLRFVRG